MFWKNWKNKYRIVRVVTSLYPEGLYQIEVWRWWFPFWYAMIEFDNIVSLSTARKYLQILRTPKKVVKEEIIMTTHNKPDAHRVEFNQWVKDQHVKRGFISSEPFLKEFVECWNAAYQSAAKRAVDVCIRVNHEYAQRDDRYFHNCAAVAERCVNAITKELGVNG